VAFHLAVKIDNDIAAPIWQNGINSALVAPVHAGQSEVADDGGARGVALNRWRRSSA
jgi:ribosomal protein L31E